MSAGDGASENPARNNESHFDVLREPLNGGSRDVESTSPNAARQPLLPDADAVTGPDETSAVRRARLALYGSHTLSTWGQRSWEFAVGLLMLQLHPSSLALVSAFGLVDSGMQVLFGASIGSYLTRTKRLRGATQMYMLQNVGVAASAAAVFPMLAPGAVHSGPLFGTLTAITIACGAASSLGAMGSTLAVERNWPKTLCAGDSSALASLNAGMRRIDLTCLIAAPIGVGLLMTFGGSQAAVIAICAWNLAAWLPEGLLLRYSQAQVPRLRDDAPPAIAEPKAAANAESPAAGNALSRFRDSWALYWRQPVLPAAFALALLYLTVMSFGTLMTAYLKSRSMTEAALSVYRGFGAVSGVAATFSFPLLHRRLGLLRTGLLGIWLQLASLCIGTVPSLAVKAGSQLPDALITRALVAGLVASRWGLWTFDLAVSQMLQERVSDQHLNVVSGCQSSLQSGFGMASYVAAIVISGLASFPWLMAGSCAFVASAAAIFTLFQQPSEDEQHQQRQLKAAQRSIGGSGGGNCVGGGVLRAGGDLTSEPGAGDPLMRQDDA